MKQIGLFLLMLAMLPMSTAFAEASAAASDRTSIEAALNLAGNAAQEWTYDEAADAWILSVVPYVAYPVVPENQGMSVCVPGAYVAGIDTDADGMVNIHASQADTAVQGRLVVDNSAIVTSSNGQVYTASTAPVLFEVGGSAYAAHANQLAGTAYARDGIIYMTAGNRGKQSTATNDSGSTFYTGDAPDMVVDGKAAIRFLRYNILLGNLPGSSEYLVVTGGSGAGAHAVMLASTGDNAAYYDYLADVGAVGVYRAADGSFDAVVSDAVWGALGYSPITSLAEADMALAFEYTLNPDYDFNTPFQKQLAARLSQEYMTYINEQALAVDESVIGFDLDGDGERSSVIPLTIEYDPEAYPETNGYHGTYLDLYLAEFTQSLQSYLDRLSYADGFTWFHADGTVLTDAEVASMTQAERVDAFLNGRVSVPSTRGAGMGGMRGGMGGGMRGQLPEGQLPDSLPLGDKGGRNTLPVTDTAGNAVQVGTPNQSSTQSAGSRKDSANYTAYDDLVAAYAADIAAVQAGDEYGNHQVALYNPLAFIANEGTTLPTWVRLMNGASEGDIAMFNSLNIQLALLSAGTDAEIEWQWNGLHVPSEILGDSVVLRIDEMYGRYVEGAVPVSKPAAQPQTANGTSDAPSGKDISSWVSLDANGQATFSLADIAAYRTAAASKAMPAFDVIDYGQEDYVFGDEATDARHWDAYVLSVLQQYAEELAPLFNAK